MSPLWDIPPIEWNNDFLHYHYWDLANEDYLSTNYWMYERPFVVSDEELELAIANCINVSYVDSSLLYEQFIYHIRLIAHDLINRNHERMFSRIFIQQQPFNEAISLFGGRTIYPVYLTYRDYGIDVFICCYIMNDILYLWKDN